MRVTLKNRLYLLSKIGGSYTNLRNKTILKSEQDEVWTDELKAVITFYA